MPDPSHLELLLSEDGVKGKGAHTIQHRSKRSQPPPPPSTHTHKRRQNFSIHAVKGKDLEFPKVVTSVQIADLD